MRVFKIYAIASKLVLLLAISAGAASYYGGTTTKPHGHTSNSDGGVVTNMTITGIFYPNQLRNTSTSVSVATSAYIVSWSSATIWNIALSSSTTFTFSNSLSGESLMFFITQSSNSKTVTWPAAVNWPFSTAPTLSTTTAKTDIITILMNGTSYYGFTSGLSY